MRGKREEFVSAFDEQSFDEDFEELFRACYRVAVRILADRAGAEDVAAEAMTRAYERWERVGQLPYRDAWILRVAINLALKTAKRTRPDAVLDDPLTIDDAAATRVALVDALRRLPRRQREVVVMRHLSGMSEQQVARTLQIGAGTVKTHLQRGLAGLRKRLGEIEEPDAVG